MKPLAQYSKHSCAECRRMKLKCDKKIPCSSCLRRGCARICPDGQLTSKGSRLVLASTEKLHEKIDTLIARIRHLEDALEISHSRYSQESHPLLRDNLRRIAIPADSAIHATDPGSEEEELTASIGSLSLDGQGSRYFGSTGAFAYLWRDGEGPVGAADGSASTDGRYKGETLLALSGIPSELAQMAVSLPISLPFRNTKYLASWLLENCLPPFPEASSLFENYWEHFSWYCTIFTRDAFLQDILSPLYKGSPENGNRPLGHRLALLFMVFSIGELMDFTQPLGPSAGLRYYLLARASLGIDPLFSSPTVTALQATYLMSVYTLMSRGAHEPEQAWMLSAINLRLTQTLGLQYDANKLGLPSAEVEARQDILASILSFEVTHALHVGRRPSYSFANFDWVFQKEPGSTSPDSSIMLRQWSAFFIRDCMRSVLELSVGKVRKKEGTYSAILQLDNKIREYPLPAYYQGYTSSQDFPEPEGIRTIMQSTIVDFLKEFTLLSLHRRFFALALQSAPEDPLQSPFASSVMACYRSASSFLNMFRRIHSIAPAMTMRLWFSWPHVFMVTLIFSSIVARSPGCSLASSALRDLELTCQLWETTSESVRGPKVMTAVGKLKHKALMAFTQAQGSRTPLDISSGVDVSDEIAALGGGGISVISPPAKPTLPPEHVGHSVAVSSPSPIPPPTEQEPILFSGIQHFVHRTETSSFAGDSLPVSPLFGLPSLDFGTSEIPPHLPTGTPYPQSFDDVFQTMDTMTAASSPNPTMTGTTTGASPTALEELGLGEGWQSVMDDLGL